MESVSSVVALLSSDVSSHILVSHGELPLDVLGPSSTRRELRGLRLLGASMMHALRDRRVTFFLDSFTAVRNLIKGGGPKPDLCDEVRQWWQFCQQHIYGHDMSGYQEKRTR